MVSNPFQDGLHVQIDGSAEGLTSSIGEAMQSLGGLEAAVAGVGLALAGLSAGGLAKATQSAAAFEEQMVEVEKVTTPETASEMGDAIQDMASQMPVAQEELAGIAEQAGRFGIEGSENIQNFTETVSKMAVATDLSTSEAGESFARLSTLMDEPIENVGDMGNVINELSNTMATSSTEITDAALRSSGTLSQMGASSEDILSLNAAMNEASESSERAGTRLRRMAQEIQDPKKVEELAVALGMNVDEFEAMRSSDPTALFRQMATTMGEGDEAADALRGTLSTTSQQALTALSQNMDGLSQAQETANQQMRNGTSLQEEYQSASSTFNSQLQITRNRLRNIGISIGETLLPYLSSFLEWINNGISAFSRFNESTNGVAGSLTLITTLITGLVGGLAGLASQVGLATSTTTALTGALSALTGPIGLVIAAVATLATAFATDFGGIRTQTMRVVDAFREALQPAIEWIQSNGISIFNRIKNAVVEFVNLAEPYVSRFVSLLSDGLIVTIRTAANVAKTAFGIISTVITTAWENVIRPFLEWSSTIWDEHLSQPVKEAGQTLQVWSEGVNEVITWIQNTVIGPFLEWADENISQLLNDISSWWSEHKDEVMSVVRPLFNTIQSVVEGFIATVSEAFSAFFALLRGDWETVRENIESIVDRLVSGVIDLFEWLWEKVTGWVGDLKDDVIETVRNLKDDFVQSINNLIDDGLSALDNAVSDFVSAGKGLVDAIVDGIKDSPGAVKNAVEDVVGDAREYLPFSPAKEGPMSDLDESGASIPETLAENAQANMGTLQNALTEMPSPTVSQGVGAAAGGGGGDTINIEVDARGSENPQQTRTNANRGLAQALDAYNVGR